MQQLPVITSKGLYSRVLWLLTLSMWLLIDLLIVKACFCKIKYSYFPPKSWIRNCTRLFVKLPLKDLFTWTFIDAIYQVAQTKPYQSYVMMYMQLSAFCCLQSLPNLAKSPLLNRDRVTHICVSKVGHHWFGYLIGACVASSHNLNHCRLIIPIYD